MHLEWIAMPVPSNRRRLILRTMAATAAGIGVLAGLATLAIVHFGWYDVAANTQHLQPVHSMLEQTMHASVRRSAREIAEPPLSAARLPRGAVLYGAHCLSCHGAPGVAQQAFGKSMQPVPGPLTDAARRWRPREMYWIIRHGIKMSGMPAWEFHLPEQDIWAIVVFLQTLPALTPQAYAELALHAAATGPSAPRGTAIATGRAPDARRGRVALTQYACHSCHLIPGVTGSPVYVGPPLRGIASRGLIAGRLPNTTGALVGWIRSPQQTDPRTAMPNLGVTETDAHDIAAYLQTLH